MPVSKFYWMRQILSFSPIPLVCALYYLKLNIDLYLAMHFIVISLFIYFYKHFRFDFINIVFF